MNRVCVGCVTVRARSRRRDRSRGRRLGRAGSGRRRGLGTGRSAAERGLDVDRGLNVEGRLDGDHGCRNCGRTPHHNFHTPNGAAATLSVGTRKTMPCCSLMCNGMLLPDRMRSRIGLCCIVFSRGSVCSVVVKGRQKQTPFQVFDAGCEIDAAAGNSTAGLTDDIRGQHGPSWANQTMNYHVLAVIPPTAARTTRVDLARRPTVQHDATALNAARALLP